MAREIILRENVLTDNILILPGEGKIFKGNYIAILKEYKYLNAWSDYLEVKRFRSKDRLVSYLDKHYKEVNINL